MPDPIKRHVALQPVSREHHYGLLLSWKIREGLKRKIELSRIKKYIDWFWTEHLCKHFEFEEAYVFPILGKEHQFIERALNEHERLKLLFLANVADEENLSSIEQELSEHIRFEERILFQEIQNVASKDQLDVIEKEHSKITADDWPDEFWTEK